MGRSGRVAPRCKRDAFSAPHPQSRPRPALPRPAPPRPRPRHDDVTLHGGRTQEPEGKKSWYQHVTVIGVDRITPRAGVQPRMLSLRRIVLRKRSSLRPFNSRSDPIRGTRIGHVTRSTPFPSGSLGCTRCWCRAIVSIVWTASYKGVGVGVRPRGPPDCL